MGAFDQDGPVLKGLWGVRARKSSRGRRIPVQGLRRYPPGLRVMFYGVSLFVGSLAAITAVVALAKFSLGAFGGEFEGLRDIQEVLREIGSAFSRLLKS